tara:strand:+ start:89 stop:748 length:660 start_codon:yes stop_codon:yes gene_type:complete
LSRPHPVVGVRPDLDRHTIPTRWPKWSLAGRRSDLQWLSTIAAARPDTDLGSGGIGKAYPSRATNPRHFRQWMNYRRERKNNFHNSTIRRSDEMPENRLESYCAEKPLPHSLHGYTDEFVDTEWYSNGQKEMETHFKNGKPDGLTTNWYSNGQKLFETHFKNGERDGLETEWGENGQKMMESNWKNGKEDGLWTFWGENGKKMVEIQYKDGEEVSREEF